VPTCGGAKQAIEALIGHAVRGYRAPNYSIGRDTPWALAILAEEGHVYDSSVHPIAHDRYGAPDAPRFLHRVPAGDRQMWEVPVGTARALGTNLPVGGGFFRLFPTALLRGAIASVNRVEGQPLVLYVHPWEFDPDQPRPPMPLAHRFRHYVGLAGARAKLDALLAAFRFTSIEDALAPVRLAPAARRRARVLRPRPCVSSCSAARRRTCRRTSARAWRPHTCSSSSADVTPSRSSQPAGRAETPAQRAWAAGRVRRFIQPPAGTLAVVTHRCAGRRARRDADSGAADCPRVGAGRRPSGRRGAGAAGRHAPGARRCSRAAPAHARRAGDGRSAAWAVTSEDEPPDARPSTCPSPAST
jgi:hypothetical protein